MMGGSRAKFDEFMAATAGGGLLEPPKGAEHARLEAATRHIARDIDETVGRTQPNNQPKSPPAAKPSILDEARRLAKACRWI